MGEQFIILYFNRKCQKFNEKIGFPRIFPQDRPFGGPAVRIPAIVADFPHDRNGQNGQNSAYFKQMGRFSAKKFGCLLFLKLGKMRFFV